ncbi:MAG: hypothetical protein QF405_00145, partial [Roseibacillus sp.]|nr:hypothetical protein [Roseibacillus sp.]
MNEAVGAVVFPDDLLEHLFAAAIAFLSNSLQIKSGPGRIRTCDQGIMSAIQIQGETLNAYTCDNLWRPDTPIVLDIRAFSAT